MKIAGSLLLMFIAFALTGQTKGTFTDVRDGKTYETVTYQIAISGGVLSDLDEYASYVEGKPIRYEIKVSDRTPITMTWMAQNLNYEVDESKCKYDTDVNCQSYGRLYTWDAARNVCPNGWHLPSDEEWYFLASLYGGVASAGEHLKSSDLGGTNRSLFNVLKPSIFWSADELDSTSAMDWKVNFRWVKLQRWKGGKNFYNAVRCVQD